MTAAQAAYEKWMAALASRPSRDDLSGLIKAMHAQEEWAASVPPMRALCRLYPEKSEKVRLRLASILIRNLERPTEAQAAPAADPRGSLEPALQRLRQTLLKEAEQMIEDGVLEVEEDA